MTSPLVPYLDLRAVNLPYEADYQQRLCDILNAGCYLHGGYVARFEGSFAAYCGCQHAVAVSNGFDALTIVLAAAKDRYGWAEGDEVVVPALSFVASALAIVRAGLTPVFIDVTPVDYLLDPTRLEATLTPRTRAIMPVHLYGRACDMQTISEIAQRYNLFVLEDAAQAHGARTPRGMVGSLGNAAAFSFYPGKNLGALGDAGAIVTSDAELAEACRMWANYGAPRRYHHEVAGLNARMDELQAAFLDLKLQNLDAENLRRQAVAQRYFSEIDNPKVGLPYPHLLRRDRSSVFHIFPVLMENRAAFIDHLQQRGVETLIHYPLALHHQPALTAFSTGCFPQAERVAAQEVSLPISPVMTDDQVAIVVEAVNSF